MKKKKDVTHKLEEARESDDFELDYDEITAVMDLVTQDTLKKGLDCINETKKQTDRIKSWPVKEIEDAS